MPSDRQESDRLKAKEIKAAAKALREEARAEKTAAKDMREDANTPEMKVAAKEARRNARAKKEGARKMKEDAAALKSAAGETDELYQFKSNLNEIGLKRCRVEDWGDKFVINIKPDNGSFAASTEDCNDAKDKMVKLGENLSSETLEFSSAIDGACENGHKGSWGEWAQGQVNKENVGKFFEEAGRVLNPNQTMRR